ncbi:unnamed protein product [Rotaria magnacalcarata]|uniref:F-box domain-containing protein n=4 Tax=Rotaria magnacalcarata TaxID=392030 RepID=A0A815V4L8_9BILA|nr:unnamed protein product [Rotaria magnacalcarata]
MSASCVGLNDLPDEILMIILKKLNNIEVFYSLQGVNQRLDRIIRDSIFTSCLTFIQRSLHDFIDVLSCDTILGRFCLQILPEIHDKIARLDLESSSMKHVLSAAAYPNLYVLGLYNINEESIQCLFVDETPLSITFKNQITTLYITIDNNNNEDYMQTLLSVANICDYIFTVFTRLITFGIYESSYKNRVWLSFDDLVLPNFCSSTLVKLNVSVHNFDDCLYLLDGRFNQLHTFYVDLVFISRLDSKEIINQGHLPNLKRFSLSSDSKTEYYNRLILPLLYRMSNLEELDLYFPVDENTTFIDRNNLKKNIINCMPRLYQFRFYICSIMRICNGMNFLTTEDIHHTVMDFPKNGIVSYGDYFPEAREILYHIYSYPSLMPYYSNITNKFPGGLYEYVRIVSLCDERPFEHEFFLRIDQSFPCMEILHLTNHKSQNRKQSHGSNNDNQNLSLIEYPLLSDLHIVNAHDDYIEQFLFHTKTYLRNNIHLYIDYASLQRVTHNFTRDATRINCTKICKLSLRGREERSNSLEKYFPNAKMCPRILF